MSLYNLYPQCRQELCRLDGIEKCISRKVEDYMGADVKIIRTYGKHGVNKFRQRMPPAHLHQCMVITGLKAKLNRNVDSITFPDARQDFQIFYRDTVRTGRNRKLHNIRELRRLFHIIAKPGQRQERIRIVLKICNEPVGMILLFNALPHL